MTHAVQRQLERLTPLEQGLAEMLLDAFVRQYRRGHYALRMFRLRGQRGQARGSVSNGDEVWAIVRDGTCTTVMLRRSTQPPTPQALHVDKVILVPVA